MAVTWDGIWLSQAQVDKLSLEPSPELSVVLAYANAKAVTPSIKDQESMTNVTYLAKALMFARTKDDKYGLQVVDAIRYLTENPIEAGSRALALGRELPAYVIAADLSNLKALNPALHTKFSEKLFYLLHTFETVQGPASLAESSEKRPNNWGAHALAARIAIDMYLEDTADLAFTSELFRGYLGDRSAYAGFKFGDDLSWQADPKTPVSINPVGAKLKTPDGVEHDVDGAQPEELRRKGSFTWPIPTDNTYPWEALQGLVVGATMLKRAGYAAFDWSDSAILRAVAFLLRNNWPPSGDDRWQAYLINRAYGTNLVEDPKATPGKNMAFTQWTHKFEDADTGGGNGGGGTGGTAEADLAALKAKVQEAFAKLGIVANNVTLLHTTLSDSTLLLEQVLTDVEGAMDKLK